MIIVDKLDGRIQRVDARAYSYLIVVQRPKIDGEAICRAFTRRINAICMAIWFEWLDELRGTSQYTRFRIDRFYQSSDMIWQHASMNYNDIYVSLNLPKSIPYDFSYK